MRGGGKKVKGEGGRDLDFILGGEREKEPVEDNQTRIHER